MMTPQDRHAIYLGLLANLAAVALLVLFVTIFRKGR